MILNNASFLEASVAIAWGIIGLVCVLAIVGAIVWQIKEHREWKRYLAGGFNDGYKSFMLSDGTIVNYSKWKKIQKKIK